MSVGEDMPEALGEGVGARLLDLAARCEAATGKEDPAWFDDLARVIHEVDPRRPVNGSCRDYGRSLDAAMTLIDGNTFFHVSRFDKDANGEGEAHVYPNRFVGDDYASTAATPALALCAAALRARAAMEASA